MSTATVLFLCTHKRRALTDGLGFLQRARRRRSSRVLGRLGTGNRGQRCSGGRHGREGIDITGQQPKRWTDAMLHQADVVVTMGCGDTCPYVPGRRYVDWPLADPAGQPLEGGAPRAGPD